MNGQSRTSRLPGRHLAGHADVAQSTSPVDEIVMPAAYLIEYLLRCHECTFAVTNPSATLFQGNYLCV